MSAPENHFNSNPRANSVKQLAELYNVVIGIALSVSIYTIIDKQNYPLPINLEVIPNFLIFLTIIIPFYHGAVRHLFLTYVENGGSSRIKDGALLVDFIILFVEGCLFVGAGLLIADYYMFAWAITAVIAIDVIWGALAYFAFSGADAQIAEKKWALINLVTSCTLALMLLFAPEITETPETKIPVAVLIICVLRTVADYKFCWSIYFPTNEDASK